MWKRTLTTKSKTLALLLILAVACAGCGSSPNSDSWKTSTIRENGTVAGCPRGSVLVGEPKQVDQNVRIRMVDTLSQKQECRVVAVDADGQILPGQRTIKMNSSQSCRITVVLFPDVRLESIKEFQFQARPSRQETAALTKESQISNAARKKQLIAEGCENYFF